MATVLVVDDVAENRDLVTMLLSCRGHDVLEASDGVGALDMVRAQHPDIVVSDVLMPGIDGLELVHRLRSDADPVTASSPVIFYTANYLEPETRPIADACGVSRPALRRAGPATGPATSPCCWSTTTSRCAGPPNGSSPRVATGC